MFDNNDRRDCQVKVVGCKTIEVYITGLLVMTDILVAKIAHVLKASKVSPSVTDLDIMDVE